MYDFGRILDHISKPKVSDNAGTIFEALTMFEHYFETNESFDHYTHGIGPGIVGLVIHAFMEFLGELVNQKLDHNVTGPKKGTPLSVYVNKLHEIVTTVVTEEAEETTGRLGKKLEEKKNEDVPPSKSRSRGPRTKHTRRKHQDDNRDLDEIEDEIISLASGSDDDNQFTTLLNVHGQEIHPPSRKRQQSRFAHKGQADINRKLDSLRDIMQEQQNKIARLKKDNDAAKQKLKMFGKSADSKTSKSKSKPTNSGSDSDIQEVTEKPDSTQPKLVDYQTDSGSEDIASAQVTKHKKKRKTRARIDSSSTEQQTEKRDAETEEEADPLTDLRQRKADLEEKCTEMERKLMEQQMDNRFRDYQDELRDEINKFRNALMGAFGKNLSVEPKVVEARDALRRLCCTVQFMGYTRRVGTDFVDRIEKSLLCGQVPERQMKCLKIDNSEDDPILGYTVDVVYEISMPVIVKAEVTDDQDDDLVLLGVSPGVPVKLSMDVKVKKEKIGDEDTDQPTQKTASSGTESLISPVFGKKAPPTQVTQSPAKSNDSVDDDAPIDVDDDAPIDVVNITQASKRTAEETPEKEKPAAGKKRKNNPPVVTTEQRILRSRTIKH